MTVLQLAPEINIPESLAETTLEHVALVRDLEIPEQTYLEVDGFENLMTINGLFRQITRGASLDLDDTQEIEVIEGLQKRISSEINEAIDLDNAEANKKIFAIDIDVEEAELVKEVLTDIAELREAKRDTEASKRRHAHDWLYDASLGAPTRKLVTLPTTRQSFSRRVARSLRKK